MGKEKIARGKVANEPIFILFCLLVIFTLFQSSTVMAAPDIKLPLPPNKQWLLTVEVGGKTHWGNTDYYHTDSKNGYYSLDFDDISKESSSELSVDILAAGSGTVTFAGGTSINYCNTNTGSWGYTVVIDHGGGYTTRYAHLKEQPLVTVDQQVRQGQKIGIMGDTGSSCGTHLHFQIYYNGESKTTTTQLQGITIDNKAIENYKVGTVADPLFYLSTNIYANPPIVTAFLVRPENVNLGNAFYIWYSASDTGNSGLNHVEIWRADDIEGTPANWTEIGKFPVPDKDSAFGSFFNAVPSSGTYWYGIHIVDNAGNWNDERNSKTGGQPASYGPARVTTIVPQSNAIYPAPPTNIKVTPTGQTTLTWDPPTTRMDGGTLTDLKGYQVFRGTVPTIYKDIYDVGMAETNPDYPGSRTYTFYPYLFEPDKTYYFVVVAYDASNLSAFSKEVSKTILSDAINPGDVTNLMATKLSDTSIRLSWTNPSDPDFCCLKLEYSFSNSTGPWALLANLKGLPGGKQTYDHLGLLAGSHYYRIHTVDISGNITNTRYTSLSFNEPVTVQQPTTPPQQTTLPTPNQKEEKNSSSGFGCGTIHSDNDNSNNSSGDISALTLVVLLLFYSIRQRHIPKCFGKI